MVGKYAAQPTLQANDSEVKLRFGGGLNTRASADEIDERECVAGSANFDLDLGNSQFRPRKQFDLAWTAPNAGRINGYVQLVSSSGSVSTLIQAGTTVYNTDFYTDTAVGTVSSAARLRGPRDANWNLTDSALIADLGAVEPIMSWDGTYLNVIDHSMDGPFIARYVHVENERAFFANVISNGVVTPHVLVASKLSDFTTLSTTNRPTSSLGDDDAWFLPTPDLRPINGMISPFGQVVMSTQRGRIYKLIGSTAQDYEIVPLHADSFADGAESLVYAGNDAVYGRPGRIESLVGVEQYGDVETNDLSLKISNAIADYDDWTLAYSSRHQRIYCHPGDTAEMWVFHKPLAETGLSPWMKWTTRHAMAFQPTCLWSMLDPQNGLEHVYMGDTTGHVYRLEGTSTGGDGDTTDIVSNRISKLYSAPGHASIYDLQGAVKYMPVTGAAGAVNITARWQGKTAYDSISSVYFLEATAGPTYGGSYYYSDGTCYGARFAGRLLKERFATSGQGSELQIETESTGHDPFAITEVYLAFRAAG